MREPSEPESVHDFQQCHSVHGFEPGGILTEHLHVVPGRMTDILTSLESKGLIRRVRGERDRRHVNVCITEEGKKQVMEMRQMISREYEGMFQILGSKDTEELIRLLKIVLSYPDAKDSK